MSKHKSNAPAGFFESEFSDKKGRSLRVFSKGEGPVVLLLHELPGMTRECIALANRLSANFTVLLPLLFGEPGEDRSILVRLFSLGPDFSLFTPGCTSPIVGWLRDFCRHIQATSKSPRIGVIGNCLTGGLVISLIADPGVEAPVMSQPALPWVLPGTKKQKGDLGVSANELAAAKRRIQDQNIQILGFRFSNDWICPKERFEALKTAFPNHFEPYEISSPNMKQKISSGAHAVLTAEYRDTPANHPTLLAFERLVAFLAWRLN